MKAKKINIIILLALLSFLLFAFTPRSTVNKPSRPFTISLPLNYKTSTSNPLVILLPGYSKDSTYLQKTLFPTKESQKNLVLVTPLASKDKLGNYFWNSKGACCNFFNSTVNDIAYLNQLTKYLKVKYHIDENKIFFLGHSNGGFMALTMACQNPNLYAGVISIAGAGNINPKLCKPKTPTSILQIHGTNDEVINFQGGNLQGSVYPSAQTNLNRWIKIDKCLVPPSTLLLDLVDALPGEETQAEKYLCSNSTLVELWAIKAGAHTPEINGNFMPAIFNYLANNSSKNS